MSLPRYFEKLGHVLRRYVDDFVFRSSASEIRTAQFSFDEASLVPDVPGWIEAGTCPCGRYRRAPSIAAIWQSNPVTRALVRKPRIEAPGNVTSDELVRWQTGPQSRCTHATCPHFRAGMNPRSGRGDTNEPMQ
jgi:hypothetical protein